MTLYHVTPIVNLESILTNGLVPTIGERSSLLNEEKCIFLFKTIEALDDALMNWLGEAFDDDADLVTLKISLDETKLSSRNCADYEVKCLSKIEPNFIEFFRNEFEEPKLSETMISNIIDENEQKSSVA